MLVRKYFTIERIESYSYNKKNNGLINLLDLISHVAEKQTYNLKEKLIEFSGHFTYSIKSDNTTAFNNLKNILNEIDNIDLTHEHNKFNHYFSLIIDYPDTMKIKDIMNEFGQFNQRFRTSNGLFDLEITFECCDKITNVDIDEEI